ncbi:hypothetical protein X943_003819 [Babesia divergens]|uniref:Uncharacterized protein n=1 Tax=Babesia divergens TaxID=32595 RepID=A0AAD9GL15_BABDI|nr:hypothetical protein X943_003819 [Babesia divergens]
MNFVRTQNYRNDKGSGGLIDFAKGSIITGNVDGSELKGLKKKVKTDENQAFKPKELFCDRDLEYATQNLTSATAILSAYSEEDIAHLDQLKKKRQKLWAKRREEEEEFVREAQRLKSSLSEEELSESEKPKAEEPSDNSCFATKSLFSKKPSVTCRSQSILAIKERGFSIHTPPENVYHVGHSGELPAVKVAPHSAVEHNVYKSTVSLSSCDKQTGITTIKGKHPIIEGYSSSDEGEETAGRPAPRTQDKSIR